MALTRITRQRDADALARKQIASVELRPFTVGGRHTFNPRITFTDGTVLVFQAEETDAESGVALLRITPARRG